MGVEHNNITLCRPHVQPNNTCVVYISQFMQTGKKQTKKKWCETQHHPTQSRSQAGSKHRCESQRHHPGQGHKSRRGPQHGQCQTEQCSHAKYPQPGRPPTDQYKNKTHALLVMKNAEPCTNYCINHRTYIYERK